MWLWKDDQRDKLLVLTMEAANEPESEDKETNSLLEPEF